MSKICRTFAAGKEKIMRKMYIQPKNEITEVTPHWALKGEGSVTSTNDPHIGVGGGAPKRRTPVF